MRLIQLSDFHLRGDGRLSFQVADTVKMLDDCILHLQSLSWQPDCIVVTGDIADSGALDAYALLQKKLSVLRPPIYMLPGNHDKREHLLQMIPQYCPADPAIAPFLCYTVENYPVRLIMLDTMRPGSHSGHFEPRVATWLEKTLAAAPQRPTLLFTHHPPFASGFGMMDEPYENKELLATILRPYPQVRLCCGHMHRAILTQWAGLMALTAPSIAMQIELDLSPSGGDEFRMEAPGYVVHHWHQGVCNSHFCQIPSQPTYSGPHRFVGSVNPH